MLWFKYTHRHTHLLQLLRCVLASVSALQRFPPLCGHAGDLCDTVNIFLFPIYTLFNVVLLWVAVNYLPLPQCLMLTFYCCSPCKSVG